MKLSTVVCSGLILILFSPRLMPAATIQATCACPSGVQSAIDGASPGDVIKVPVASVNWSTGGITINKAVTVDFQGSTVTFNSQSPAIEIDEQAGGSPTLANLTLKTGTTKDTTSSPKLVACYGNTGSPFVIHDCHFFTNSNQGNAIRVETIGGLIYNCTFDTAVTYPATPTAIQFQNSSADIGWSIPLTLGDKDAGEIKNVYVEDCKFYDHTLSAFDISDGARVVFRHNTFDNSGGSGHGVEGGPFGARSAEFYNNTFVFSTTGTSPNGQTYPVPINWWIFQRGGVYTVQDNVMPAISSQAWGTKASILATVFNIRRTSQFVPCQKTYPAFRQCGVDTANGSAYLSASYFLTPNYYQQAPVFEDDQPDSCGNGQTVFGSATSPAYLNPNICITGLRPGYVKAAYPHPLRNTAVSPTPTPTASPSATPSASPTPTASPTPSSTPTPSGNAVGLFKATDKPVTPSENDAASVELGMKFSANRAGKVTAIRFYKGWGNTGTHTGTLWSASGTVLARVTFQGETATGWQQAILGTPVPITAGTMYVVSYHASQGHYADDQNYFLSARTNGTLTAPASGGSEANGGNGVYRYGSTPGFPTGTWNASNYWIDAAFAPSL